MMRPGSDEEATVKMHSLQDVTGVESVPGVIRRTLAHNEEGMLCHFAIRKGSRVPLHSHRASQIGFVISGRARFLGEGSKEAFLAAPGDSYAFGPHEVHGLEALEDCEYIEAFSPPRPEYLDD
jgi:quercetin dioxygenase-like cupin family protein